MKVSIVIDGEQFDIMPTKAEHLIEFLKIVQNQYVLQDRFIRTVRINGKESQEPTDLVIHRMWKSCPEMTIHIHTEDMIHNVFSVMSRIHQAVTKLRYDINLCAEYFQLNAIDKADSYWSYSIESLEWVLNEVREIERYLMPYFGHHQALLDTREKIKSLILELTGLYGREDYLELGKALENQLCPQLLRLQRLLEELSQITKLSA